MPHVPSHMLKEIIEVLEEVLPHYRSVRQIEAKIEFYQKARGLFAAVERVNKYARLKHLLSRCKDIQMATTKQGGSRETD